MSALVIAGSSLMKSSFVMTVFNLLREYVDPMYSNPHCALRVVNETDPFAYSKHPYWKDLVYDESCKGDNLTRWIEHQTIGNQIDERYITDLTLFFFTKVLAPASILYGLYHIFIKEGAQTGLLEKAKKLFFSLFVAYVGATVMLMHTHFDVDILFLTGGIYHHAVADAPAINYKTNTITEGYVLCGASNRVFYNIIVFYLLSTTFPRIRKLLNPALTIGLLQVTMFLAINQVGKMHPVYHDMARNGSTPEMDNALPYTHAWRAFKHCITHHDNGYSFSGDLFLDPLWDGFLDTMAYLHNHVWHITFGSPMHYLFSMLADAIMGMMGVGIIYGSAFLLSLVFTGKEKNATKVKSI